MKMKTCQKNKISYYIFYTYQQIYIEFAIKKTSFQESWKEVYK